MANNIRANNTAAKHTNKKNIALILAMALILTLIPQSFAFADTPTVVPGTTPGTEVPIVEPEPEPAPPTRAELLATPTEKNSFSTGDMYLDALTLTAYGTILSASFTNAVGTGTELAFVINEGYSNTDLEGCIDQRTMAFNGSYSQRNGVSFYCGSYIDGVYNIAVKEKINDAWIEVVRPIPVKVAAGQVTVLVYDEIINNNRTKQKTAVMVPQYTDKLLYELRTMVYDNPITRKYIFPDISYAKYYKQVSDEVVGNAYTDYEKMKKIYIYVASNFYYDRVGLQTKIQYDDPYKNLKKLRNKTNSANSQNGLVSITCNGYSAMVMALGRAQGIPCRMVYGYKYAGEWDPDKITVTKNHYWVEAFIASKNKWITIDATNATSSSWDSKTNTWKRYMGCDRMSTFDMSDESLANRYYIRGYCGSAVPYPTTAISNGVTKLSSVVQGIVNAKKAEEAAASTGSAIATDGTTPAAI